MYPRADPDRVVHGVHWGVSAELSERLHRVGPSAHHRVSVCVPGGTLLPVHLRDRGGRALPLLCHRHQIQQRHTWEGVLHGQGPDGESPLKRRLQTICAILSDQNTINSLSVESALAIWVTFLFCVVAWFVFWMQALCWPGYINILRFRWCPRYSLWITFNFCFEKLWFLMCSYKAAFYFSHSQPNRVANSFEISKEKAWALRCCTESRPLRNAKSLAVNVVAQQQTLEHVNCFLSQSDLGKNICSVCICGENSAGGILLDTL